MIRFLLLLCNLFIFTHESNNSKTWNSRNLEFSYTSSKFSEFTFQIYIKISPNHAFVLLKLNLITYDISNFSNHLLLLQQINFFTTVQWCLQLTQCGPQSECYLHILPQRKHLLINLFFCSNYVTSKYPKS